MCELASRRIGTHTAKTPGSLVLPKSRHDVNITGRKECFTDGTGVIGSRMVGATAGNILLGGVVGLAVDAASGAMNKYEPHIDIEMKKIAGCRVKPVTQPATTS